ncbi:MAG: C40 family peptidase [Fidelibacterota bacterium]|nr:MAG: C40 family peptidase [Candidatus Neomarinimicrobiota bacterium]
MWPNSSRQILKVVAAVGLGLLSSQQTVFPRSPQDEAATIPEGLEQAVENIRQSHALDTRVEIFEVHLSRVGNQVTVRGELTDRSLRGVLLDALHEAAGELSIVDSIQVLPAADLQPSVYGIVSVSVANMRKTPSHHSELVNQAILGTVIKLYKYEDGFYYGQNRDRYLGWISSAQMLEVDSLAVLEWQQSQRVVYTANYGLVRDQAKGKGNIIADLVPGAVLKKVGRAGKWMRVAMPDGKIGYVERRSVVDEAEFGGIPTKRDRLISIAKSYLGIPYLWGGTSTKGFDCSGFVQTACRMNNIDLPRDASQQVQVGEPVEPGEHFENVIPGDLLFFGRSPEKISHVGIYLGDYHFIHSSGWVHINSLNPENELYNAYRHRTFQVVRRIHPE